MRVPPDCVPNIVVGLSTGLRRAKRSNTEGPASGRSASAWGPTTGRGTGSTARAGPRGPVFARGNQHVHKLLVRAGPRCAEASAGSRCDGLASSGSGPRPAAGSWPRLTRLGVTLAAAPPLFLAGGFGAGVVWTFTHCTFGLRHSKAGLTYRPRHSGEQQDKRHH